MTFIVIGLIVCVAALNILIALTMMVMEKTRDIAVLMSFGVRREQVRLIFLLQGLLISVVGTVIGLLLGYGLSLLGGHYRFPLFRGSLFHRLPALRSTPERCTHCCRCLPRYLAACDALPV